MEDISQLVLSRNDSFFLFKTSVFVYRYFFRVEVMTRRRWLIETRPM